MDGSTDGGSKGCMDVYVSMCVCMYVMSCTSVGR